MHEVLLEHFTAMLACRDGLAARDMVQKQALRTRMQLQGGLQTAEGQDATACNGLHKVAEMVLVLAGMGQMRAGAPPGMQERRLFALASRYLSLYIEYEQVDPRALLPKKFAESLVKQFGSKEQLQNSISTDITHDKPQVGKDIYTTGFACNCCAFRDSYWYISPIAIIDLTFVASIDLIQLQTSSSNGIFTCTTRRGFAGRIVASTGEVISRSRICRRT